MTVSSVKRVRVISYPMIRQHLAIRSRSCCLLRTCPYPTPYSVGRASCGEGAQAHHRIERNNQVRILTLVAHFKRILMKLYREDDTNWPKKNIVGKQELEIRVGNDHIAFEVRSELRYR